MHQGDVEQDWEEGEKPKQEDFMASLSPPTKKLINDQSNNVNGISPLHREH